MNHPTADWVRLDAVLAQIAPANGFVMGIDPGLNGALTLYHPESSHLIVFDMPVVEVKVGKALKRRVDLYQLGNWIDVHRSMCRVAIIEDVTSSPQMGVASAFSFGFSAGAVESAVAANAIPLRKVRPVDWKSSFGLLRQEKDASRQVASRIAPQWAHHWPLKKNCDRAEAFLLAYWGSKNVA